MAPGNIQEAPPNNVPSFLFLDLSLAVSPLPSFSLQYPIKLTALGVAAVIACMI